MKFEKVSYAQFKDDILKLKGEKYICPTDDETLRTIYDNIKLPKRGTAASAGYDFYWPYPDTTIFTTDDCAFVPTGIRWAGEDCVGKVLMLMPRSGLGFKKGMRLRNTIGVIDADYQYAGNEGHIMIKFSVEETHKFERNKGFIQGIILPFYTVDDDDASALRTGGMGSTDKINK